MPDPVADLRIRLSEHHGAWEAVETILDTLGLGEVSLDGVEEDRRRWIFTGDGLMESYRDGTQPTGHYTRGFLCGAVSRVTGSPRVAGVETRCQSMGDDECRFAVRALR